MRKNELKKVSIIMVNPLYKRSTEENKNFMFTLIASGSVEAGGSAVTREPVPAFHAHALVETVRHVALIGHCGIARVGGDAESGRCHVACANGRHIWRNRQ